MTKQKPIKFQRQIQGQNRVSIPQEILTALELKMGDFVEVQLVEMSIIIRRKE